MKNTRFSYLTILMLLLTLPLFAQKIQYSRENNRDGIHTFEPSKADNVQYDGFKLQIGGAFRQGFQALSHENTSSTKLYALGNGFNLAAANLNFDVQLEDGIRIFLENYMASRHHNEFWVKGGYIQIDKLPMFGNPEWFTKYVRAKIGHMEINYGDTHFRRSDGGNAIWNPFIENNIVDQFTTEIGGEAYIFPTENITLMLGMSNGLIRNNILDYTKAPVIGAGRVDSITRKAPSILLKASYDKNFQDVRVRLSASMYTNPSSPGLTLYSGDRTGSGYFGVMENAAYTNGTSPFTSGRFNPGLTNSITAIMINPFIKYKGFELFGTLETATGKTVNERPEAYDGKDRSMTQVAVEGVYRFLANEQLFIGARYNTVKSRLQGATTDVEINRFALSGGWFPTKNLLLKGEYVSQAFDGFAQTDVRNGGRFNGFVVEAVVGF
ncbi:MAG TPA: hypothetical protein PKD85_06820 [Saprospiraceae bacterium]|nr:hypothetical protein [Saprospiraceae bacterium]